MDPNGNGYDRTSRYYGVETATYVDDEGRTITHLKRRFLPQGASMPLLLQVTVHSGERLDLIAGRVYGAPEQFWRICDANNAMNPFDLTDEVGSELRVSPPQFQQTP